MEKLPIMPPLLINNKLESDFKIKAYYFNSFFTSKSTPMHLVRHNIFQPPSFPHFVSIRKLY